MTGAVTNITRNADGTMSFRYFLDEETAINEVEASAMRSSRSDVVYNLAGQRVLNPTSGLYIVNGRRILVR